MSVYPHLALRLARRKGEVSSGSSAPRLEPAGLVSGKPPRPASSIGLSAWSPSTPSRRGAKPKRERRQTHGRHAQPCVRMDAAMSARERTRTRGSSRDGRNPRRRQNAAASRSTALTSSARPPTSFAAVMQRCRACFNKPVPMPRPAQPRSVASWPSSRHGTGSGGWPVRIDRGRAFGTTAVGARP
jgi:hypothetical protein